MSKFKIKTNPFLYRVRLLLCFFLYREYLFVCFSLFIYRCHIMNTSHSIQHIHLTAILGHIPVQNYRCGETEG